MATVELQYYLVFVFTVITACQSRHAKFGIETYKQVLHERLFTC